MEALAKKQDFKTLKFKNRHGVEFHDADLIVGVDYEDDEDDNYKNDEAYKYNEDTDNTMDEETKVIDQLELDDLASDEYDPRGNEANPNQHHEQRAEK